MSRSHMIIGLAALGALWSTMPVQAKQRSPQDQALYEKAVKDCNGPHYPSGATPYINYAGGWYRCVEPNSRR